MQFKTSIVGAACLLSIALPTLAQDTMNPSSTSSDPPLTGTLSEMVQQRMQQMKQPMMAPGMGMAPSDGMMAPSSSMMAMSAQDQLFMVRAAEGNLAEITAAQMAVNKSKTPGVKSVAQTIITGHTQAQNDLMALAMRKGMMLKPMLSPTHMAVSMSLQKAKGANFDKMYMSGQTDDHENTIALFQAEIAGGQDEDLKAYAQKYLPDIVGHTIMIYTVAKQVMAPGSEMRPAMPPVPPGVTPTMMPMDGMGMDSGSNMAPMGGTSSGTGSGMAPMNGTGSSSPSMNGTTPGM